MKKLKKPSFSTFIIVLFILLLIFGTIIIIHMRKKYSWECISTIVSLLSFLATLLIPILVLDIQRKLNENNDNEKASRLKIEKEISNIEIEIEKIKASCSLEWDKEEKITASDVYDYICVSIRVTIKEIAEHFKTTTDEIKPIISLLCLRDELIQSYIGVDARNPKDDSVWFKKIN